MSKKKVSKILNKMIWDLTISDIEEKKIIIETIDKILAYLEKLEKRVQDLEKGPNNESNSNSKNGKS